MAALSSRIVMGLCSCVPGILFEACTSVGVWTGSRICSLLLGRPSEIELLREELTLLRFELDEIHHTDWIVVAVESD